MASFNLFSSSLSPTFIFRVSFKICGESLFTSLNSIDFIVFALSAAAQAKDNSTTLFFTTILNFIIGQ